MYAHTPMPTGHTPQHCLQATRPQAVFCLAGSTLRHPRIAQHTRVPAAYGPRRRFAARMQALQVRTHTLTLKFLQGHT